MDQSTNERLNRFIDGDLDPAETEELTAQLETDAVLRRELDGLQRVRESLRSIARKDAPPPELDALIDPLLRGRPEPNAARPWVRWLATAAAVVLGVTVVLEVNRRQPDMSVRNWQERAQEKARHDEDRFSLAPLPTSAVPADEQVVGAADRLVAAPEPEVDPVLDSPPALEVIGPLERGDLAAAGDTGAFAEEDPARLKEEGRRSSQDFATEADAAKAPRSAAKSAPAGAEKHDQTTASATRGTGRLEQKPSARQGEGAQLFVFMAAETAWRSFTPNGRCEAGRYAIRIRVEDNIVREVWPVANPPAPTRQVRASQLVVGLEMADVPDGEYSAEVVIERRAPTPR